MRVGLPCELERCRGGEETVRGVWVAGGSCVIVHLREATEETMKWDLSFGRKRCAGASSARNVPIPDGGMREPQC